MTFVVGQTVKAGGVSGTLVRQNSSGAWQVELSDGHKVWRPLRALEPFAYGETVATEPTASRKPFTYGEAVTAEPSTSMELAPDWNPHLQRQPSKPGMFTCCAVRPKTPVAASTLLLVDARATAGAPSSLAARRAAEKATRARADTKRAELLAAEPAMEEEAAAQAARDATSTCTCAAVTQAWHDSKHMQHVTCPRLPGGLSVLTSIEKDEGYDQVAWTVVIQALECGQCGRRFRSEATTMLSAGSGVGQGPKMTWIPLVAPAAAKHAELTAELAELEAESGPKLW